MSSTPGRIPAPAAFDPNRIVLVVALCVFFVQGWYFARVNATWIPAYAGMTELSTIASTLVLLPGR